MTDTTTKVRCLLCKSDSSSPTRCSSCGASIGFVRTEPELLYLGPILDELSRDPSVCPGCHLTQAQAFARNMAELRLRRGVALPRDPTCETCFDLGGANPCPVMTDPPMPFEQDTMTHDTPALARDSRLENGEPCCDPEQVGRAKVVGWCLLLAGVYVAGIITHALAAGGGK